MKSINERLAGYLTIEEAAELLTVAPVRVCELLRWLRSDYSKAREEVKNETRHH